MTPTPTSPGIQFDTYTAGSSGAAPTDYADAATACRQSDSLIGQKLYESPAFGNTPTVGAQLYTNQTLTTAWAPSIPGSRWFKLGKSGTYWAVLVSTSGVVQTVTNCTAIPSNTPAPTTTPTMTPTPTQTPIQYAIFGGYGSATDACRGSAPANTVFAAPGTSGMMAGFIFYTNSALTNTYNGTNTWHNMSKDGTTWGVLINTVGVVQSYTDCSTIPSESPSATPATTPSVTPSETPPPPSPDPSPSPSSLPPTLYTQFNDCNSSPWYIEGDYTDQTYTSTDVISECLLSGFTTTSPSGTLLSNIAAGTCGGCP
jgi:hypothetical protein